MQSTARPRGFELGSKIFKICRFIGFLQTSSCTVFEIHKMAFFQVPKTVYVTRGHAVNNFHIHQACRKFLAKQLTLSQPGRQIMPATVLRAPSDFQTLRRLWDV